MVRHGQAAAGFSDDLDPGLSELGRAQAEAAADALAGTGPLPIVTSPLRRCRETAAPLGTRWGVEPVVDVAVGEIVSPDPGLEARHAWLREVMGGPWSALAAEQRAWRQTVIDRISTFDVDTIVFSHYMAINVVVGAATDDDRLVCFAPDNCSWSVFDVDAGKIRVVELGRQANTTVS